MKKAKRIVILFLAILAIFSFSACVNSVQDITGVKQIQVKVNEATDEKLLDGVEVLLKNGATKKPSLEKEQGFNGE